MKGRDRPHRRIDHEQGAVSVRAIARCRAVEPAIRREQERSRHANTNWVTFVRIEQPFERVRRWPDAVEARVVGGAVHPAVAARGESSSRLLPGRGRRECRTHLAGHGHAETAAPVPILEREVLGTKQAVEGPVGSQRQRSNGKSGAEEREQGHEGMHSRESSERRHPEGGAEFMRSAAHRCPVQVAVQSDRHPARGVSAVRAGKGEHHLEYSAARDSEDGAGAVAAAGVRRSVEGEAAWVLRQLRGGCSSVGCRIEGAQHLELPGNRVPVQGSAAMRAAFGRGAVENARCTFGQPREGRDALGLLEAVQRDRRRPASARRGAHDVDQPARKGAPF